MFLQQAITYFEELKVATEGGKEQTELLHRIAEKLAARATYPARWHRKRVTLSSGGSRGGGGKGGNGGKLPPPPPPFE